MKLLDKMKQKGEDFKKGMNDITNYMLLLDYKKKLNLSKTFFKK